MAGQPSSSSPQIQVGSRVGPYKILREIGQGGFGTVFLALQEQPLRRQVALKLIKPGMASRQILARFDAERQALAIMNHPNIARIYDASTADNGQPYFVMEWVPGMPITAFCDRHRLSLATRLDLFISVCQAIQHAHQKGIVHRDIKPSNILVATDDDERAVPKVIDFGLAKAIDYQVTEESLATEIGQVAGTLEYMSPEQASLSNTDVDTRSDVYSLGVLLYELLTGTTPLDRERIKTEAFDRVLSIIREEDVPRPSARLSSCGDSLPEISALRNTDPRKLGHTVRGDLDCIVMKSLEKDPERRYGSASGLAAEIERFLKHEPIEARPPEFGYRVRRFVGKHRFATAATMGILLLFAALTAYATGQALRARKAERRSRADAATAEEVNRFLENDLLAQADARSAPDRDLTLRTVLDRATSLIGDRFVAQPLIEASIRQTIGDTYLSLGEYKPATVQLERAQSLRAARLNRDAAEMLETMTSLGELWRMDGKYEKAETIAKETLDRRTQSLGSDHPQTLISSNNLAVLYVEQGRFELAEPLFKQVEQAQARAHGKEDPRRLKTLHNHASLLQQLGKYEEAESTFNEVLRLRRQVLGPEHLDTLATIGELASVYQLQGRYDESETLRQQTLDITRRVLGEKHPETLKAVSNLAVLYYAQGKHRDAVPMFEEIVKINRQTLGDEHPETLSSLKNLAAVYLLLGRVEEAAPLLAQSLEARRRLLGEDHPDTLRSMVGVASVYQDQGKYAESEQLYQQALEIQVRTLGETHADVHITRNNLAMLYQWQGRYDLATPLFRQALASVEESLGKDHPHTLAGKYNLAEVLMTQGALDEALPIYLETRADQQRVLGQQHPYAMVTSNRLAELYYRRGEFERAEEVLREVLAIYRAQQAGDNPPPVTGLSRAVMRLATCLVPLNQAEEAESLAREAVQLLSQAMPDNWRLHEARSALGEVHLAQHNVAAAEPLLLDSWQRLDQQREDIKPTERLPILRDALRRLVKLFEDTRQPEQVQRWQQELEQLDAQTTSPQPEQARPGPVAAP